MIHFFLKRKAEENPHSKKILNKKMQARKQGYWTNQRGKREREWERRERKRRISYLEFSHDRI
jgi:hypothetical protein